MLSGSLFLVCEMGFVFLLSIIDAACSNLGVIIKREWPSAIRH